MLLLRFLAPCADLADRFAAALRQGFTAPAFGGGELAVLHRLAADPTRFVAAQQDRFRPPLRRTGAPVPVHLQRWAFDVVRCDFVGLVTFRAEPASLAPPVGAAGHVDVAIAPWWRRRGCGSRALALLLDALRSTDLPAVDLVCAADDAAGRRMIQRQAGVERVRAGTHELYRLVLRPAAPLRTAA